jgi:multifunctional 2-oxoglutarate metabolism enzyme
LEGIVYVKVRGDPLSNDNSQSGQEFGANEWLVDEMYSQWLANPDSIDKEWQPILERYHQLKQGNQQAAPVTPMTSAPVAPITPQTPSTNTGSLATSC